MTTFAPRSLDIVIPACGETTTIGATLGAILADSDNLDIEVVVVANGDQVEETARAAEAMYDAFAARGVILRVLRAPSHGKPAALNLGDRQRRGSSVLYLDADTVFLPGTLAAIVEALAVSKPRLVAPRPILAPSLRHHARAFGRAWLRRPGMAGDVVGAGCYATNRAGRLRWGLFPDIAGDDMFVRGRFTGSMRVVVPGGGFVLKMPSGRALVVAKRRWDKGNRQVRALEGRMSPKPFSRLRSETPFRDMVDVIVFLAVALASRLDIKQRPQRSDWLPYRTR